MPNMSGSTHNIVMNFTQNEAPGQHYNFRQEQLNHSSMSHSSKNKNKRKKSNPQHPSYQVRKYSNKKKAAKRQPPNKQSTDEIKKKIAKKSVKKKKNKTSKQNNSKPSKKQNTSGTSNKQNYNKIYKQIHIQKQKVVAGPKKKDEKLKLKILRRKLSKKNQYNEKSRSFQYRKQSNDIRREEFNDNSYYGCENSYQSIKEYNFPGDFMPLNFQYDAGESGYFYNMSQSQNNNGLFGNQHRQIVNCYINFSQPCNNSRPDEIPSLLDLPYIKSQGTEVNPSNNISGGNSLLTGESIPGYELQVYNNYQTQFRNLPIDNNSEQYPDNKNTSVGIENQITVNQDLNPDNTNMGRSLSEEVQGGLENKDDNGNKTQDTGAENRETSDNTGVGTTDNNSRNDQNSTEIKNDSLRPSSSSADQNNVATDVEYNADVENFLEGKFEATDTKIFPSVDKTENQTNCNEADPVLRRESESLFLIDNVGDQQNISIFNDPLPVSPVKSPERPENVAPNKTYQPTRYWNTDHRQLNIYKPPQNQSKSWRNPAYKKNDRPVVFDMQKIRERVELEANKRNLNKSNKSDIVLNVSTSENLNLYNVEEFVETYSSSDEETVVESQVSASAPVVLCLDSDTDSSVYEVPMEPAPLIVISDDEDNGEKTNDGKEHADSEIDLPQEKDVDPSSPPSVENSEQNVDRIDRPLFTLPASTPKKQSSKQCPSPSDSDDFIQNDLSTIDGLNSERQHSKSKPTKKCSKKKSHKKSKTSNFSVMDVYDTESTCSEIFESCLNTSCESLAQVSNPAATENPHSSKVNKQCDEMDIRGFEKLISPVKKTSNQKKVTSENKNSEDNFIQTETNTSDPSVSMMFETCVDFTPVKTKGVNMRRTNSDTSVSSESSLASEHVTVGESFERAGKKKKEKKRNSSFSLTNENEIEGGVAGKKLKQSEKKSSENKSNPDLELAPERKKRKNKNVSSVQSEDSCDETILKKKKRKHKNSISEDLVETDLCDTSNKQKKKKKDKTKAQEVPQELEDESRTKKRKPKQNACSTEVEESKGTKNKSSKDQSVTSESTELCHGEKNKKKANKRRSLSENSVLNSECDDSICVSEIENSDADKKGKKKKHKKRKEKSSDVYENTENNTIEQENNNSVSSSDKLQNKSVVSASGVSTGSPTVSKLSRKRKHGDSLTDVSTSSKNLDEVASHGPLSDVLYNTNESLSDFKLHSEVGFPFGRSRRTRWSSVQSKTDGVFVFGSDKNNDATNVISSEDRALDARMRLKTYWTADLQKFYNTSWGSLSYDLKKELEEMKKMPYKEWSVLQSDHSHSYGKRTPHCTNCRQLGHMRWQCKKPYHHCWMCSSFSHAVVKCPEGCCLNCGAKVQKGTFITSCCKCFNKPRCTECKQMGHTRNMCPDFWRRYHKTVSVDIRSAPEDVGNILKNNKERWCSVCAGRWHTASECLRAPTNLEFPPNFPNIVNYKNAYKDEPSNKRFRAAYNTRSTWSIHNIDYDADAENYIVDGKATFELRKEDDIDVIKYASNEATKQVLNDEKISSKICKTEPVFTSEEPSDIEGNADDGKQIDFADGVSEKTTDSRIVDPAEEIRETDNTEENNKTNAGKLRDNNSSDVENKDVPEKSSDFQSRTRANNDANTNSSEFEAISLESSSDDDIVEITFSEDVIEIDLSDEDETAEKNGECLDSVSVPLTSTSDVSSQTSETQAESTTVDDCNQFLNLSGDEMKKMSSVEGKELLKYIENCLGMNCRVAFQNNRALLLLTGKKERRQKVHEIIKKYLSNCLGFPEGIISKSFGLPKNTKGMAKFLYRYLEKFNNLPNYSPQELFDRMKDIEYNLKFRNFTNSKKRDFFIQQLRRFRIILNSVLFGKGVLGEGHKHLMALEYYIDTLNDLDKRNITKIPKDLFSLIKTSFEYIFSPCYRNNYSELINTFERTYNDFYDPTVKLDKKKRQYYKHILDELIKHYKDRDPIESNKFAAIDKRLIDDLITEREIMKLNQEAAALKINTKNIPENRMR